jgi:hypothetical protein
MTEKIEIRRARVINSSVVVIGGTIAIIGLIQRFIANRKGGTPARQQTVAESLSKLPKNVWTFVAMQYCWGFLNRTYLVFVTDDVICAGKVLGVLPSPMVRDDRWKDPLFYVDPDKAAEYVNIDLKSSSFRSISKANFQILRKSIEEVNYNPQPKPGMGAVPSSGRIFLKLKNRKTVELILLGTQDGQEISERLKRTEPVPISHSFA